ncbi:hypothetical protein [Pseudonocardia sp. NPDC049635]
MALTAVLLLFLIVTGFNQGWTQWQFIGAVAGMAAWDRWVVAR